MSLKKEEFKNYNILVIGDDGIDKFVYGDATRLAPEAPVPVLNPITETTNRGMAGNVVENLNALGLNTYFISNSETILKTRYVDDRSGQILLRVDENDRVKRVDENILKLITNNRCEDLTIDAIIISDYNKGFLEEEDIQFICENNKNVFIDTKKILGKWCTNASFIKINHVEYLHTEYTIHELGIEDKLIITLSSKGCQHKGKIYPVEKVQIRDVSGAGDTFLSGLVAEYVLTNDIEKAIPFAQQCATVVVQKPGVSTILDNSSNPLPANGDLIKKYNVKPVGEIISDNEVFSDIFEFGHKKFSEVIPEGSVVLDIGAHVGGFSMMFASCVGEEGKVISFEPNPRAFESLKFKADNNPSLNIIPYNYACTKENGKFTFHYTDPGYGTSMNGGFFDALEEKDKIKQTHFHPVEVEGVNVLEFLNEKHSDLLDKINFIKTDTEGFDKEVLRTLAPLIKKNKPVLMAEAFEGLSKEEVLDFWNVIKSFDYEIYDASPFDNKTDCTGPLTFEEFEYYLYNIVEGNFFCFHKDEIAKHNLPTVVPGKTAVVVFGRNDGYKEKERFAVHLTTMLETFDEVIYVDWNSPKYSFLYEVLDMIPKTGRLKHFAIPPEYAKVLSNNDEKVQPCLGVLSFNIGLRRTDAEWIVLSTTDVIPPTKEALQQFIAQANKHSFYTFSRRDIEYDDVIANLDNLDEYRKHLDETTEPRYLPTKVTPNDEYSIFNCCGDFQLAPKNLWYKIHGYEESMLYACFIDTNVQKKATLYGFDLVPVYDVPLYHMSHKGMSPTDGFSPSKQYHNDAMYWVEYFDKHYELGHDICTYNADTWGYSNVEIKFEVF